MVKKRRDFTDVNLVDLVETQQAMFDIIADLSDMQEDNEISLRTYRLKDSYGKGTINQLIFEDITISTYYLKLKKDVVLLQKFQDDFVQLSFLIEGEKVISIPDFDDIFFESGDSYMAEIKSFEGFCKIAAHNTYREIKIKLSSTFLPRHGFTNDLRLKKLIDDNLVLPITNEVTTILETISQLNYKGAARIIYLKAKIYELLAIQVSNYKKGSYSLKSHHNSNNFKKLFSVKKAIDEHLDINYSVAELSKEAGINKTVLNREFIRVFGITIHQYSVGQKIKKAKSLLLNTDAPIYHIAEEIGYKNATHFSAAFKRHEGITPKQFKTGQ